MMNMEAYNSLLQKYECTVKDGVVYNKHGKETKIKFQSFIDLESDLDALNASNDKEIREEVMSILEEQLQIMCNYK